MSVKRKYPQCDVMMFPPLCEKQSITLHTLEIDRLIQCKNTGVIEQASHSRLHCLIIHALVFPGSNVEEIFTVYRGDVWVIAYHSIYISINRIAQHSSGGEIVLWYGREPLKKFSKSFQAFRRQESVKWISWMAESARRSFKHWLIKSSIWCYNMQCYWCPYTTKLMVGWEIWIP